MRFSASSRIHCAVAAHVLGQAGRALPVADLGRRRAPGNTGGRPANFGGISISALLISTATGLRSEAWASRPSRCASSGIVPPPANGSRIGGGLPPVDFRISACASREQRPRRSMFSHTTSRSMMLVQPLALGVAAPPRSGTARDATTGRRRAGRTAPPGTPRAVAAPTTGAASTGGRGGSTSPAPTPR